MPKTRYAIATLAVLAMVVLASNVASAATWKDAQVVTGTLDNPSWETAQTVNAKISNKVWVNATQTHGEIWGYDEASSPIMGIVWLVIGLLVPMILGIFLGRMGYMIGAIVVTIGLSVVDPGWWWVSLLVIIQSGVMIMRGGMW